MSHHVALLLTGQITFKFELAPEPQIAPYVGMSAKEAFRGLGMDTFQ